MVFNYHFMLLSHLLLGELVNMPYFLLESLKNMAHFVQHSQLPHTCVTNHGLVKLLILHTLEQQSQNWVEFVAPTLLEHSIEEDETGEDNIKESSDNEEARSDDDEIESS